MPHDIAQNDCCHWDLGRFMGVCGEGAGGVMCDTLLGEAARRKRRRLENWLDEQLRAQIVSGWRRRRDDFLREAEQQAVYTLLNRMVILRLMEEPGPSGQPLRKPALIRIISA
jgi:hypothetical protein